MNGSKTFVLAAGVWALTSSVAFAADMPLLERAPVIEEFGGWYLRGDIGMTNQKLDRLSNIQMNATTTWPQPGEFDSGWLFGLGVGYQFNSWLRADITGEYRGKTAFSAEDLWWDAGNIGWRENHYGANKSEWLGLLNLYADLGTWWNVTPFIGAGIGVADIVISNYTDRTQDPANAGFASGGYARSSDTVNFAWALHAGLSYQIAPGVSAEFAYRYLNLGDAKTKDVLGIAGTNWVYNPTTFHDIESHDLKLALRWALGAPEAVPVVRKY